MKESRVSGWTIFAFLIGTLVGTGGVWEWKKIELEAQSQEIERAVKTADLREKENDQYAKILDLTNEYINAVNEYSKPRNPQLSSQIVLSNKIVQLKSQLDVMKDNFKALENNLAQIEGRQPRNIPIDFIPPPPPTDPKAVAY
jgi:hypothetical protein